MKKGGSKKFRRLLAVFLAAVFLVSALLLVKQILQNRRSRQIYEGAVEMYVQQATPAPETTKPPPATPLAPLPSEPAPKREFPSLVIDFEKLLEVNKDITGWLWVPGTDISYPVVQGASNSSYLERAYTGEYSNAGSIFMDSRNARDFSDPNTIIYGHNMRSGAMFGSLKKFREQEYLDEHPWFSVFTPEGQLCYDIFAVVEVDLYGIVYNTTFNREGSFDEYLQAVLAENLIETDIEVSEGDKLCTLSTCTSEYWRDRLIVVGRLWED